MNHRTDSPLPVWLIASVVYLCLPFLIFAMGWLKLWISIPLVILVCAALALTFSFRLPGKTWRPDPGEIRKSAVLGGLALAFAVLTGLCDWVPQSADYLKHNLILGDLVQLSWPVRYSKFAGEPFLCYGLGYYMVPAAVGKLCGISSIYFTSFAWASLGLFLCFSGISSHFKRFTPGGVIIFLFCAGLGGIWHMVKSGFVESFLQNESQGPWLAEHLMNLGLYTSNLDSFTRMLYQPQHAIAGWLGGLVIYQLLFVHHRWAESAMVLAAVLFWSPVTALGLSAIGIAAMVSKFQTLTLRPVIPLSAAIAMGGLLIIYYMSHIPISEKGFIWQLASGRSWVVWYFLFVALFVLLPTASVGWLEWKHHYLGNLKPVVLAMVVVLLISPLFKLGQLGDLRMQISGPAFLFVGIAIAKGILEEPSRGWRLPYAVLVAVFLAGALFPVFRTLENVAFAPKSDYRIATLRKNQLRHITDLKMDGFDVTTQYLGASGSKAAELILKPIPKR